jgi:phosphoserine phosphatase RsbU/P
VEELTAVYDVATLLAEARDVRTLLQRTVEVVASVMEVRASSIRLVERDSGELVTMGTFNLSAQYLSKGRISLSQSEIDRAALSAKGFEYVEDMTTDPRIIYPQAAREEGIVSMLAVGMRYKGRPVGTLRVYTDHRQSFPPQRIELLRAIAAQAAAAIENARLLEESIAAANLEKQVKLAASVQRRLLPKEPPHVHGIDLAAVYVPCFELGGDFYDFIPFPDENVGIVVADVSGKGIPASLIMASVRSALRAQVDNLYYLYEAMQRVNLMLCRDTEPQEFVTLFYGVLDARNRRLTYCSAGHPPGLLLRDGKVVELDSVNTVLGIDCDEHYQQSILQLESGDTLLLHTDGLFDAANPASERFGRKRVAEVFARPADSAGAAAHGILWEMRKFVGITRPTDDVTMVVAKVE